MDNHDQIDLITSLIKRAREDPEISNDSKKILEILEKIAWQNYVIVEILKEKFKS